MIPEELYSKLQRAKETKDNIVLTPIEVNTLMCTIYFYRELFKKLNITLDHKE